MSSVAHRLRRALVRLAPLAMVWVASAACAGTLPDAVGGQALPSLAPMLARVSPAVVNISSTSHQQVSVNPFFDDPFMRQFFGLPPQARSRELVQQSLGSGVVLDAAKGYILTNNHVVAGADDITVTLTDGKTYQAKLVGTDAQTDLAVIRIEAQGLTALPLADSAKLRVGDFVVAIGDPFGLGQSATSGIVSGLQRQDLRRRGVQNYIQTDASINPGNSGGALVNLAGQLVGINSMIYSPSGASAGLGFAIPSNLAARVMAQLIAHGRVERGELGISTQDLTPRLAGALGLRAAHGALVTRVAPASPAAREGLQAGDLIISVDGKPVRDAQDLRNAEGLAEVGGTLRLGVERGGRKLAIAARLVAAGDGVDGGMLDERLAGAALASRPATDADAQIEGVTVASVRAGSRAARNGLVDGDVLVGVNDRATPTLAALRRALASHPRALLLTLVRQGQMLRLRIGG